MRVRFALILTALFAVLLTTVVVAQEGGGGPATATVPLKAADGTAVGTATLKETSFGTVDVTVTTRTGLRSGFHGFHVHAVGKCEGPDFSTAGGHLKAEGQDHQGHNGDLPPLLVKRNGTATQRVTTDRFKLSDLRDADGSAIIVHAGPDNFANVPARYGTPDRATLDTGDSGGRAACGVVP